MVAPETFYITLFFIVYKSFLMISLSEMQISLQFLQSKHDVQRKKYTILIIKWYQLKICFGTHFKELIKLIPIDNYAD